MKSCQTRFRKALAGARVFFLNQSLAGDRKLVTGDRSGVLSCPELCGSASTASPLCRYAQPEQRSWLCSDVWQTAGRVSSSSTPHICRDDQHKESPVEDKHNIKLNRCPRL